MNSTIGSVIELNGPESRITIDGRPVATTQNIPTRNSQLVNDSNYVKPGTNIFPVGQDSIVISSEHSAQYIDISRGGVTIGDDKPGIYTGIATTYANGWATIQDQDGYGIINVGDHITIYSDIGNSYISISGENLATEQYVDEHSRPVPTNISYFENDVGYLTAHQSLENYATKVWVQQQGYLTAHQSLENYASKVWVQDQGYLTAHQSLAEYATKTYCDGKTAAEAVARDNADSELLARINSKPGYSDIPTRTSQLVNDSNFVSALPDMDEYYTKTESDARFQPAGNYLTSHQSLAEYPTRTELQDGYQVKGNYLTAHQPLTNYYTKDEADERFGAAIVKKLYAGNEQQYIDGNRLVWRNDGGVWQNTGTLALESEIPGKTSQLQNDSGYLTAVNWDDIQMKPDVVDETKLARLSANINGKLAGKLDLSAYDSSSIYSDERKIDVNGNVYAADTTPGYLTDWEFSDGNTYEIAAAIVAGETVLALVDTGSQYATDPYETLQDALDDLETALTLIFKNGADTITATRHYEGGSKVWNKIDEIAYASQIPEPPDAKIDELSAKTNQISSAISGGQWVQLSGLLDDDTPVVFEIFARGI